MTKRDNKIFVYAFANAKHFVRSHPTKKRGVTKKCLRVFRLWKDAYQYQKKTGIQMIRIQIDAMGMPFNTFVKIAK